MNQRNKISKLKGGSNIMGNIVLLDDLRINKIARGESIERPSYVNK